MECKAMDYILQKLPERVAAALERCQSVFQDSVTELILRANRPVCMQAGARRWYLTREGSLTDSPTAQGLLITDQKELEATVLRLCDYSVYACQEQVNRGFITIDGGVRVGLCGRAVLKHGEIANVADISTLSFRVAREVKGCSLTLLGMLEPRDGVFVCGTPGSGKTTLIRDMARMLSYKYRVSLLDERGELSAYHRGGFSFDIGFCDVYYAYPKGAATVSAVRSMAPEIIVCDELGDRRDAEMLRYALRCGVSFIATAHASTMDELRAREMTAELLNTGAFRYVVFLGGREQAGRITRIYELNDGDI
ncbi:MAG: hypothetical protein IJI50_03785 [Ruminococcus sp.]|nr:hypothetical protein [Ruminococcus sp.]